MPAWPLDESKAEAAIDFLMPELLPRISLETNSKKNSTNQAIVHGLDFYEQTQRFAFLVEKCRAECVEAV